MQYGVTAAAPRFGWVLDAAGGARGAAQSAYQIQVYKGAAQTGTPLWDSGNVTSARSYLIPYAGPALASDTTYSWRVRASATTGTSATGAWAADWATAAFRTGFGPDARGLTLRITRADVAAFVSAQLADLRFVRRAVAICN